MPLYDVHNLPSNLDNAVGLLETATRKTSSHRVTWSAKKQKEPPISESSQDWKRRRGKTVFSVEDLSAAEYVLPLPHQTSADVFGKGPTPL